MLTYPREQDFIGSKDTFITVGGDPRLVVFQIQWTIHNWYFWLKSVNSQFGGQSTSVGSVMFHLSYILLIKYKINHSQSSSPMRGELVYFTYFIPETMITWKPSIFGSSNTGEGARWSATLIDISPYTSASNATENTVFNFLVQWPHPTFG
jgi:hypothetical protein